ncbi:MAG: enolase C-terminal domain-like protein [Oscillospiraceae bacterium]
MSGGRRAVSPDFSGTGQEICGPGLQGHEVQAGFGVRSDVEVVHAVREAVGPDIRTTIDANCAYDVAKAKRILFDTQDADLLV